MASKAAGEGEGSRGRGAPRAAAFCGWSGEAAVRPVEKGGWCCGSVLCFKFQVQPWQHIRFRIFLLQPEFIMKALDEPPYLTVGTDVSAKYRGAFCEAKIKTAKRLVKVKVTFRHDSSTLEVQDDHIKGPLKVGTVVEVRNPDGAYQEAVINKLTDASWYTVVFDDGDEKTLRRSSLCLKGERHFAESETLDQLPLTNPEHFGTPVIGKKTNRGRRSNHIPEEESSSSSSDEDEDDRKQTDELLGKVVCVETVSTDKKKNIWFPGLVVCPDCSDEVAVKKDNVLVRSFKDGKFSSVSRKDVREISESSPRPDAALKQAFDQALEFCKNRTVPSNWKTELKEESSSSEAEEEDEDEKEKEDNSSEEEEEIEPFPEERDNFLQQLYKFMEDRGTPINKRPVLGYRNLNLFKLFRLVHKLGGFDNIESGAVWKQVYQDLGIPVLNSAAGYNVKCAYKKYLYGFEEYCTSANVEFKMALPEKTSSKSCKEHEQEVKKQEEVELNIKETKVKNEEKDDEITAMNKQVILAENETEKKENDKTPSLGIQKCFQEPPNDQEKELRITITNDEANVECNEDTECKNLENQSTIPETEEREIANDVTIKEEDEDEEGEEEEEEDEEEEEEEDDKNEEEEFECYPPGMKVQVRYGRGKSQKMYEASVKDSDIEGGEVLYLVHYCGWNVRYDEWIKADKIVRPADKNVPKIKHRKKIKNKADKDEKYSPKAFKLRRSSKPPFHVGISPEMASKPDIAEAKTSELAPNKSLEIISILNGLQGNEHKKVFLSERNKSKSLIFMTVQSKDEKSNGKDVLSLENSSNSSSDEDEVKNKLKLTPNKKYNGLDDKRKSLRTNAFYPGFSEVSEKRIKLLSNSDERLQNTRAKDRKDVWSSIQGQWPKKTLKELFSDSDTEAAASPPHASPEEATPEEHLQTLEEEDTSLPSSKVERPLPLSTDTKPVEEKPAEMNDKKVEFPSSGSNSVLNTPPTTPESPPSVTVADSSRHQSGISISETLAPSQEEVRSIKSETDSTIEVDSIVGELQDLQSEGNVSPTGFDASVSSSSSNQPEHTEKACTGQKRLKDSQGGGPSKKQKRSHKSSVVNNKKKNKSTNSSDSEELSAGESITKSQPAKSVSTGVKSQHTKAPARTQSPGKCGKNGEKDSDLKEQNSRLPKLYKWSFQLSDLENMTSAERIAILQEKLQEIRKHYMSLKSEVASIDRRRKRLKKKERESAATTSSSSSSPSSSTITAAVMLSLADPPVSNSSQNGMSVECR
ncbi:AT-rich interactive domain-containing protein 4B [Protobothrops mucrosquamatus]|uniref:AT-rich interactive domain-containing protein 4B n=1 Tax=Protobothrops mucrosquamatus TaxID=103944 RepID=UPI0010FB0507|nr:AT-rich interactive domain-containing protein 4B [Protobothrops mucrosquamatus]